MARISDCRSCGGSELSAVLNLGSMPLSDRLLRCGQLREKEPYFPLEVVFCPACGLVQLLDTVDPNQLFCEEYPYYSSFSDVLLQHSRDNVHELIHDRHLDSSDLIVELASNDGYLLKNYVEQGIPVLGIDPARGPAQAALAIGVPTLTTFFTQDLARQMRRDGKVASIIHANNVLAHVQDTNGFVAGLRALLADDGVVVIEVPYVKDLIENCEFDTIYHEHLCYFSVSALDNLFRRHALYINRIRRLTIHGGSLRLYVEKTEHVDNSVTALLRLEADEGIGTHQYYKDFSKRVEEVAVSLGTTLRMLKSEGKRIAAYGAAAKGTILINYVDIGRETVDFVVDRNFHKQGKYMPGKHIRIESPDKLLSKKPDYALILPWNFADEIIAQQGAYRAAGGKFIVPMPELTIV